MRGRRRARCRDPVTVDARQPGGAVQHRAPGSPCTAVGLAAAISPPSCTATRRVGDGGVLDRASRHGRGANADAADRSPAAHAGCQPLASALRCDLAAARAAAPRPATTVATATGPGTTPAPRQRAMTAASSSAEPETVVLLGHQDRRASPARRTPSTGTRRDRRRRPDRRRPRGPRAGREPVGEVVAHRRPAARAARR